MISAKRTTHANENETNESANARRDQEERDARMRQWVMGAVGLGFAATTLVVGLLVAFG